MAGFGPVVDEATLYLEDPDIGMNLPTIVAMNTAAVYAALRDDLRNGTRTAADARDAVRLAHLVAGVLASASGAGDDGTRSARSRLDT